MDPLQLRDIWGWPCALSWIWMGEFAKFVDDTELGGVDKRDQREQLKKIYPGHSSI